MVVPEKQGLKPRWAEFGLPPTSLCLSGGSRKTRIETLLLKRAACLFFVSKWWFQKNKD